MLPETLNLFWSLTVVGTYAAGCRAGGCCFAYLYNLMGTVKRDCSVPIVYCLEGIVHMENWRNYYKGMKEEI